MALHLHRDDLRRIEEAGKLAYPHECCGFLLGAAAETERTVARLLPADNAREGEERRTRFAITPRDFLEGEKTAREEGLDIIGFYHSHPDAPAQPSAYDTEHAWPWYSYVIVSVAEGRAGQVTSWVLKDDRSAFTREDLTSAQ